MPESGITPEDVEQAARNWVHRLEQAWNDGNLDGCIQQMQPHITITTGAQPRTITRRKLQRALRIWFAPIPESQAKGVIKSVAVVGETVQVDTHIHFRCLRGDQLEEAQIQARFLMISAGSDTWEAASIHVLPVASLNH